MKKIIKMTKKRKRKQNGKIMVKMKLSSPNPTGHHNQLPES